MRETIVWYEVDDDEPRYKITVGGSWDIAVEFDAESVAESCAEDYHSNHDGWEDSWPLIIALFNSEDGPEITRFEVDREAVPQFTASRPRVKP